MLIAHEQFQGMSSSENNYYEIKIVKIPTAKLNMTLGCSTSNSTLHILHHIDIERKQIKRVEC